MKKLKKLFSLIVGLLVLIMVGCQAQQNHPLQDQNINHADNAESLPDDLSFETGEVDELDELLTELDDVGFEDADQWELE